MNGDWLLPAFGFFPASTLKFGVATCEIAAGAFVAAIAFESCTPADAEFIVVLSTAAGSKGPFCELARGGAGSAGCWYASFAGCDVESPL